MTDGAPQPPLPLTAQRLGFLRDTDGVYSSKRIAAFVALAAFIAGGVVDTVMGTVRVPPDVMQGLLWITLGGLSLALGERWSPQHDGDK